MSNPRGIHNKKMWAYFAPDGHIQVRSIGETKKESRLFICNREHVTWEDYEQNGYSLKRINVIIEVL